MGLERTRQNFAILQYSTVPGVIHFNERAFMRREFRQGVLQQDLWARSSVSNPVPGVSISMVHVVLIHDTRVHITCLFLQ